MYPSGEACSRDALTDPSATRDYLRLQLVGMQHEVFACVFLDIRYRVMAFEPMFRGMLDGVTVYPREVVKAALAHSAAAVILAHNHLCVVAEQSRTDRSNTQPLVDAPGLVYIHLFAHLVFAGDINV